MSYADACKSRWRVWSEPRDWDDAMRAYISLGSLVRMLYRSDDFTVETGIGA